MFNRINYAKIKTFWFTLVFLVSFLIGCNSNSDDSESGADVSSCSSENNKTIHTYFAEFDSSSCIELDYKKGNLYIHGGAYEDVSDSESWIVEWEENSLAVYSNKGYLFSIERLNKINLSSSDLSKVLDSISARGNLSNGSTGGFWGLLDSLDIGKRSIEIDYDSDISKFESYLILNSCEPYKRFEYSGFIDDNYFVADSFNLHNISMNEVDSGWVSYKINKSDSCVYVNYMVYFTPSDKDSLAHLIDLPIHKKNIRLINNTEYLSLSFTTKTLATCSFVWKYQYGLLGEFCYWPSTAGGWYGMYENSPEGELIFHEFNGYTD